MAKSDEYVGECVQIFESMSLLPTGSAVSARTIRLGHLSVRQTLTRLRTLVVLGWVMAVRAENGRVFYRINMENERALAMVRGFSNKVTTDTAITAMSAVG
ncbi:MAG: hypothetical protein CR991_11780 [Proteobacteria bacterium]|nr:MAG: hypothetical protein CR991_11780 [Pseudomonadota bacterium]